VKKEFVKQFVKDAIVSFIYWTAVLSPFMIFVMKIGFSQYIVWLSMQIIIVPPLGAVFSIIIRKLNK
jgi:hypothetical protein